jgi:hypothetical protein
MARIGGAVFLFVSFALCGCVFNPGVPSGETSGAGGAGGTGGSRAGTAGSFGSGTGNRSGLGSGGDVGLTGSAGAPSCGQMNVGVMPLPPDILVVQDRSESMDDDDTDTSCKGGCGANSKWSQVTAALSQVVTSTDTTINWGIKFFSDDGACGASADPAVTVGAANGSAVASAISGTSPGGSTPTRDAITSGAAYLATLTDPHPKYLLLATDGLPNCPVGCAGMSSPPKSCTNTDNPSEDMAVEMAVTAAAQQGFKTFVIGIGNVSTAVATLNQLAIDGGEAQTGGTTSYYAATDPTALESALDAIVGVVASCTISLANAPAGFTNVAISADTSGGSTVEIPQDPTNGWSYGPNMQSVNLNGTSCDNLKNGTYSNFQFYYACPGQSIHIGAVTPDERPR